MNSSADGFGFNFSKKKGVKEREKEEKSLRSETCVLIRNMMNSNATMAKNLNA